MAFIGIVLSINTAKEAFNMTIGFHYHIPAFQKEDGSIWLPGYLGVFLDSLAEECDRLVCFLHSPLQNEFEQMDYVLRSQNVTLVDMTPHDKFYKRLYRAKKIAQIVEKSIDEIDLMLIRGPSTLLPTISSLMKKHKKPFAYLLVGDHLKSLSASGYSKVGKLMLWFYFVVDKLRQNYYAKNALVFANSLVIYNEYLAINKHTHEVRTTTLSTGSIYKKDSLDFHDPVELLYAGRIDKGKGISDIINAMKILKEKGIGSKFNLVGWETSKGYIDSLFTLSRKLGLDGNIVFHGKKKVGEELLTMYRKADIYVLASNGNEGFPRTIWEAMASSTPVIATTVGSIPYFLTDRKDVLLVSPDTPDDIANAIEELSNDEKLREELIKNGLKLAASNTLEVQSKKMVGIMKEYLDA